MCYLIISINRFDLIKFYQLKIMVKAIFKDNVFQPLDPVNLHDGDEVELTIEEPYEIGVTQLTFIIERSIYINNTNNIRACNQTANGC